MTDAPQFALTDPARDPIEEADAYRDTLSEDDADALSLARGEIAWLREAIRRFEIATITVEQQAALAAASGTDARERQDSEAGLIGEADESAVAVEDGQTPKGTRP